MFTLENQHIFKQLIVTAGSGLLTITDGLAFAFSAVLLPELRKDTNFDYNENMASWIASITPLSMIIGSICAGTLIDKVGRKSGHIVLAILCIISWITLSLSYSNTSLLIGRFIAGLAIGPNKSVSLVYIGEITDPKYRSLTLVSPSIMLSLGVITSHALGGYVFWRTTCYIYTGVNLFCLFILLFLRESPLWLITTGKTEEGIEAFKWFRGKGIDADNELNLVLQRHNKESQYYLKDMITISFIKPLFTVFLLSIIIQFNGVNLFTFYAQDIISQAFEGNVDPFILMVLIDIVRLGNLIVTVICNKFVLRKKFFLFNCFLCAIVLFCLSARLTFIDPSKYSWLSITITVLYMAFGGSIVALSWSFVPELFSANLRGLGSGITSAMAFFFLFVIVKITPDFTATYGHAAMFICYGIVTTVVSVALAFLLPETSRRTLQNIEDSYKKKNITESSLLKDFY